MERTVRRILCLVFAFLASHALFAQISSFRHVVIIVQENRTPDNLFQGLCAKSGVCSISPTSAQYNIQTGDWLDNKQAGGTIEPLKVALDAPYDLGHSHDSFLTQCDLDATGSRCRMDGSAEVSCGGTCPSQPQLRYVDNASGILGPYLSMATQYGWANYMFQTNQGPSFPAHQFLFGGTSAPITADDALGIFASENVVNANGGGAGCTAKTGALVQEIRPPDDDSHSIYPCFEHNTLPDVLPSSLSWRYYAPNSGSIWTAPNAIEHICQPDRPTGGKCVGTEWKKNVDLTSADVLKDIGNCALRNLSWVIPTGQNSDHAGVNTGGGPSWVASVVNAIGQSACKDADGSPYWNNTAIIVTWDDWGGWYDHESPTILAQPEGDYQYGFRVPFVFVSAYTSAGLIDNNRHDFGSILRFAEHNFGLDEGVLNFADARARDDLSTFFDLNRAPRPFVVIPARLSATYFLNDHTPPSDPDDD